LVLTPIARYHGKPRVVDLRRALEATARHCREQGVARLAMPRIGCGLDLLQWGEVRAALEEAFSGSGVTVTVYSL
jgi:O-acetyl-ADP-ribose deacetylase (regulator of RNase III)